jgi:hypothetical protein
MPEEVSTKPWWTSWTLWFNGLLVLAGAALEVLGDLPPEAAGSGWIVTVTGVLNGLLRFKTSSPVGK